MALLAELLLGQAKQDITTGQGKRVLASVRPRDFTAKTRHRVAAEELADLIAVEAKLKKATVELKPCASAGLVAEADPGIAPVVAARILAAVVDVAWSADRNRFLNRCTIELLRMS